jgi:hypothetical protein
MDRPGGSLGAITQPVGRMMVDNIPPRAMSSQSNTVRRIPNNVPRKQPNSVQGPIAASQVIVLAREALKHAIEENQTQAAEVSEVSNELKPRVTIDLSYKNIQIFPEEVVDIIKDEIER